METSQLLVHYDTHKLSREELKAVPTPEGTPTHRPVPHIEIVEAMVETLSSVISASCTKITRSRTME